MRVEIKFSEDVTELERLVNSSLEHMEEKGYVVQDIKFVASQKQYPNGIYRQAFYSFITYSMGSLR